jgi:hypothetical protein
MELMDRYTDEFWAISFDRYVGFVFIMAENQLMT